MKKLRILLVMMMIVPCLVLLTACGGKSSGKTMMEGTYVMSAVKIGDKEIKIADYSTRDMGKNDGMFYQALVLAIISEGTFNGGVIGKDGIANTVRTQITSANNNCKVKGKKIIDYVEGHDADYKIVNGIVKVKNTNSNTFEDLQVGVQTKYENSKMYRTFTFSKAADESGHFDYTCIYEIAALV